MKNTNTYSPKVLADAIVAKVGRQVDKKNPDAKLMFAIFKQAVIDLFGSDKNSAASYLRSDMTHLALIGIEAEWVRFQFEKLGISYLYDHKQSVAIR